MALYKRKECSEWTEVIPFCLQNLDETPEGTFKWQTHTQNCIFYSGEGCSGSRKFSFKTIFFLCITKFFKLRSDAKFFHTFRYMTSSVSRQDEPNPALWLATRAGKWSFNARSGFLAWSPKIKDNFCRVLSHIINPSLTKPVWSKWPDIGLVLFLCIYGPWPISSNLDLTLGQ